MSDVTCASHAKCNEENCKVHDFKAGNVRSDFEKGRCASFSERGQGRKTELVEAWDFMGIKPQNSSWNHGFRISRIKKGLRCKGCSPGGWPPKRFSTMTKPVPILSSVVSELPALG